MKIHNKLFFIIFIFSFILVGAILVLVRWSIDKGMVEYVNTREIEMLQPIASSLSEYYQKSNQWQYMEGRHRLFTQLLREQLQGTEFSLPRPERRIPPPLDRGRLFGKNVLNDRKANQDLERRHNRIRDADKQRPQRFTSEELRPKNRADITPANKWQYKTLSKPTQKANYALVDINKTLVVGSFPNDLEYSYLPILYEDETVGYFAISKRNALTNGYELDFIEQQTHVLWLIGLGVMLLVFMVSVPLARHVVQPIRKLTKGMHKLTQGRYQQSISVERNDELGQLSRDFNELAVTLAQNDSARKRWLADISHELRTPVAILRGELEAILDGVRPLTLKQIASAHQETEHLARLINDLQALTSADIGGMAYRKNTLDLSAYLKQESAKFYRYLGDAKLAYESVITDKPVVIYADKTRLSQLFDNIVNNCVKYAGASAKVKLTLSSDPINHEASICIEDDGQGVEKEHLPHLFEHLYRVESSRNRALGGSGLGLSICAQIVSAHGGKIAAKKSSLGGLAVVINFPLHY